MKLSFFIFVFSINVVFASYSYAQKTILTLEMKDKTVSEVLDAIEQQSEFRFYYNSKLVDTKRKVTVNAQQADVFTVLNQLFTATNIGYKVVDKDVILVERDANSNTGSPQLAVIQQGISITGTVTDQTGESLPGVNVMIKGSLQGVATDMNGRYSITAPSDQAILVFTFIGYVTQEMAVGNRRSIDISLSEDTRQLEEVVVVGYGTQKKSHLTGAVGSIKMNDEITGRPATEVGQALYGQIPGVMVLAANGRPGSSSSVQIRGINSISAGNAPLIVIDGIPMPDYNLNLINNSDIESIEILKDASSSAIYGSRGSNGVILISTKSIKSEKPKVSIDYLYGLQSLIKKVEVMSSAEYASAYMDAAQNGWVDIGGDPNAPNTIAARSQYKYTWPELFNTPEKLINTDWQNVVYRTAPINKLNVSIAGGSDKLKYFVSGGLVKQEGIIVTSEYSRYDMSLKLSSKLNNWIEVGGMSNVNLSTEREPWWRIPEWSIQYPRIYPVYAENGYLGAVGNTPGYENYNAILFRPQNGHPLYRITDDNQHKNFNSIGNVYMQANIAPGLIFKTTFNYSYMRRDDNNYEAMDHNLGPTYYTVANMTVQQQRIMNFSSQNILSYDKTFNDHSLSAMLGFEFDQRTNYTATLQRRGYDNDLLKSLSAGQTIINAADAIGKNVLISYFGRLNYNYRGKYLISAAFRRDGSSRFAPNNKWGNFPSISAGWVLSEEPFFKQVDLIHLLKARVSYGFTGNNQFADYRWIGTMGQGRAALNNSLITTYYPTGVTNPDLKWERTRQLDVGLDIALYNSRIQFTADFYHSISDDLLLNVPVPAVSGFTQVFKNIGKLENKGLEFILTTYNIVRKSFSWNTKFNISGNRNKILEMGPDDAPLITTPESYGAMQFINQVGSPSFSFFGYQYDGVYMNQSEIDKDQTAYPGAKPGDGRYKDVNNDGKFNEDDRTVIGNYQPDFVWGLTNNFTYMGFDFSVLLQGVQGCNLYDDNVHRSLIYHEGRNFLKSATKRWRSEQNPGNGYQYRLTVDPLNYEQSPSSFWLTSGTYFRVKSVTLGYTFSSKLTERYKITSLRVFFNGLNLFTHQKAPVFDPESFRGSSSDNSLHGVNGNAYPSSKVFSFGIRVEL